MSSSRRKRCDFMEYKYVWNRLFFSNSYEKMKFPREEVDQFWLFMQKYSSSPSKSSDQNKKRRQMCTKLMEKLSNTIPDEWKDIDFLKSELKELNCQHYIESRDIYEFRDVLLMFVDFNKNRKTKKTEKLKVFQQNLPIHQYKNDIIETIKSYSVILIAGDTGCGKSTQVPQYLLQVGYENICCTQPRRLACISLRHRLSFETADEYGSEIGYQIRFEKHKTKHTKFIFLTEGLLLRQMIEDPFLSNYNIIILDEIHERHLSCDFLLGAIKCLLNRRKDNLKVILMSATVNCELFSKYFGNCPVVKVPGRLYPINVEYFPIEKFAMLKSSAKINPEPYLKLLRHIDGSHTEAERGDVLIFLSGFLEIETVGETLKTYADQTGKWIILYLHSSLSIAEQDKVFDIAPDGVRKCILSTNIAETSLTIDGIRFVIDSGKVKEMYYDAKIRMQKLQEIWVSKASAEQRKGRAGRTGPGICFRLYSPKEFDEFLDFSTPEIKRVSLESLLLNMISMGLNDVRQFPFLESPDLPNIESTVKCLIDYGTLDENEKITLMGRILSKLPVDISIGKMLIMAVGHNLIDFFLSAAACLSIQAFFSARSMNDVEAVEGRKRLNSMDGDLFSYINFYSQWLMLRAQMKNTHVWCRKLGLEEQRFYELTKLRNQFREIVTATGLVHNNSEERSTNKIERKIKHGERKLYRKMKSDYDQHKHKKRKVLSLTEQDNEDDEQGQSEANIKDIEFKLIFDAAHLLEIEQRHHLSSQDIQVAKLIVCMSFYPQLAISDLDNLYRTDCDQMFHTKNKPFVVLHPSSVFYNQPELLKPKDIEYSAIGMLSSSHTLLGYISFIETSKTYICNCYPISALHALLLCACEIDTNEDMSRIVCDDWIELQAASWEESQDILLKALRIRQLWSRFLTNLFNGLASFSNELDGEQGKAVQVKTEFDCAAESIVLKHQMSLYLSTRPKYAIKRLLSADLKNLHNQKSMNVNDLSNYTHKPIKWLLTESHQAEPNTKKGGLRISNINFNCLQLNQADEMIRATRKLIDCPHCKQQMYLSTIESARHEEICSQKTEACSSKALKSQSNSNLYFCPQCDSEFEFNKIGILRHRQMHASS